MKKLMIIALLLIVGTVSLMAQPNNRKEKINAARVAYITDRLDFNEKESAAFWPVYNRFESEKKAINKKYAVNQDREWMTDEEAEKAMLDQLRMEEEITKLKRSYYWEFKKVISPRKIAMLNKAEREFKKMVLNRMQNNRRNQNGQRPGPGRN
jgi:Skp family chaperone for outer membrane proteins